MVVLPTVFLRVFTYVVFWVNKVMMMMMMKMKQTVVIATSLPVINPASELVRVLCSLKHHQHQPGVISSDYEILQIA